MDKRRMWELKQSAAAPDVLELYIYGEVESDGYDWWTGEAIRSETSANAFREELAKHPQAEQINLYINSYGGSVFEGTAIYNQLKRHPAKKTAYIDGFACSIASVIAMAADEVVMPRNALMMVHNMWNCVYGNAAELRKAADDLDIINNAGKQAYIQKAGDKLTEEFLSRMMDDETWLTAEECIRFGLADRFAEHNADAKQVEAVMQKATLSIQQRIEMHKSMIAQMKAITEPCIGEVERDPKQEEKPETAEEKTENEEVKQKSNSIMQMFEGFF